MRKFALALVPALLIFATAAPAMADPHPSNGESSTGRNEQGFGEGPHCHINTRASEHSPHDFIRTFPSHQGHASSGLGEGPFAADPNCDGDPGN
jgi:hypothetical protein